MKNNLELIKKLRKITLAGFLSCKNALKESDNNLEKAIEILKKKGINKVLKKSLINRSINEGQIVIKQKNNIIILIEMRCETDFVSKNKKYLDFINEVIELCFVEIKKNSLNFNYKNNEVIKNYILKESYKFGEKIELSEFYFTIKKENQSFSFYRHSNGKYGSVLIIEGLFNKDILESIAMQVVATCPEFISVFDISENLKKNKRLEIEKEINKKFFNKPLDLKEKIITNKLNKELEEITLLSSKYIKDETKTIEQILKQNKAKIISMKWFVIGD